MKRVALFVWMCCFMAVGVLAQSDTTEFVSDDDSISFSYPDAWTVEQNDNGTILLDMPGAMVTLTPPAALADSDYSDINDPARLADAVARANDFTQRDFRLFVSNELLAARYDYDNAGTEGFLLVFPYSADIPVLFDVIPDGSISPDDIQRDIEILMLTFTYEAPSFLADTDETPIATEAPDASSPDGLVAFSSEDETLTIRHSPDWFMGQEDDTAVFGFLADPPMSLTIYPPESLLAQRYRMRAESAEQFLEGYGDFNAALSAIETLEVGAYSAAKRGVTADTDGLYIALQLPGGAFVVAEGFMFDGEFTDDAEDAMLEVLETLAYSGEIVAESAEAADTAILPVLREYAVRDLDPVLNQLRLAGVIPFGGSPAFGEDFAFFQGTGTTFFQFSTREQTQNLIMAGEITYFPGSDERTGEECGLAARLVPGEVNIDAYVSFGVNSDGAAFYRERTLDASRELIEEKVRLEDTIGTPYHFVLMLFDEQLALFINGDPVFTANDVEVRQGLYAIYLKSNSTNTRCETRIVRVYELPTSFVPGLCEVRVDGLVNRRGGAGTEFGSVGQLEAGDTARIIGQTTGADGFLWWQLEDQSWVRDDVVFAEGDCRSLFG